jgi:hypothetical protein
MYNIYKISSEISRDIKLKNTKDTKENYALML